MDIDEVITFKKVSNADEAVSKKDAVKIESFFSSFDGTIEEWQELRACYKGALMEIKTKFDVLNEQFAVEYDHNPIETIKTRLKKPKSIYDKLIKQGNDLSLAAIEENINDMAGIRVICAFRDDIYLLANCLKNQDDINILAEKDYIRNPKPNGYRSLHLIIEVPIFLQTGKRYMKVEVQLRTIAMDFWASLEHKIRYKKDIPEKVLAQLGYDLKSTAEVANLLDEQMQSIRNNMRRWTD